MMKRLGLLPLFLVSAAFGTTLLAVDVPVLSQNAELIVVGMVRASAARMTADGRRIVTDTEIEVLEVLKGKAPGPTVVVMQAGGVVGEVGQRVEGTARFVVGEEVVVFLDRRGADRFAVTAMAQGNFRVVRSTDGKTVTAVPQAATATTLIDPRTHKETSGALRPMPLTELKAKVASALAAPASEPTGPILRQVGQ